MTVKWPPGIAYVRWSDTEQGEGNSEARQRRLIHEAAAFHGIVIPDHEWHVDAGVPSLRGANLLRGKLGKILKRASDGAFPANTPILFESFDRFSRMGSIKGLAPVLALLEAGLVVITTANRRVYRQEDEIMAVIPAAIELSRGHNESLTKLGRSNDNWRVKREHARLNGEAFMKATPAWLQQIVTVDGKRRYQFTPHVETVRQIFAWAAQGMGRHKITRRLNDAHVPTFSPGRSRKADPSWHDRSVKNLLGDRRTLGEFQPYRFINDTDRVKDGDPIENFYIDHETQRPAIDIDLWQRARRVVEQNQQKGGRRGLRFANILSGLTRCALCGGPMNLQNSSPNKSYLKCDTSRRRARCANTSCFGVRHIERLLYHDLLDEGLWVPAEAEDRLQPLQAEIARLEDRLSTLATHLTDLEAKLATGAELISEASLRVLAAMESQQKQVRQQLAEAAKCLDVERGRRPSAAHLASIRALREAAQSPDPAVAYPARSQINASLREIVDHVVFAPSRGITIVYGGGSRELWIDADTWRVDGGMRGDGPREETRRYVQAHPDAPEARTFAEAERRFPPTPEELERQRQREQMRQGIAALRQHLADHPDAPDRERFEQMIADAERSLATNLGATVYRTARHVIDRMLTILGDDIAR